MIRNTVVAALAAASALAATPAHSAVNVVATTSSMGMLARTVGGDAVKVTVLSPPDRDAHYLLAKPSMMVALRRADLLVAVGAELEVGWLPAAIQGASNPRILPGQPGYFEGAAQIDLVEAGQAADRAKGDVHPEGNPHYYMDPERMARVAKALAGRLAALDPANAARFQSNAEELARGVALRVPEWKRRAGGAPGAVLYHKDTNYLTALLNVPILGYVEPLPGIPPTAAHLQGLVRSLSGKKGVILYNTFQSGDGPSFLARNLGWKAEQLQLEVDLGADGKGYLDHVDRWVTAIASGKP
jgi:zinc/manganese transport system substrate-binding protein